MIARGFGDHHVINGLVHGKIPARYALNNRGTDRSPPIATRPSNPSSSTALRGSGKASESSSIGGNPVTPPSPISFHVPVNCLEKHALEMRRQFHFGQSDFLLAAGWDGHANLTIRTTKPNPVPDTNIIQHL